MKNLQKVFTKKITGIIIVVIVVLIGIIWTVFSQQKSESVYPVGCNTTNDCGSGSICMTRGPIIAGEPMDRVCVPNGEVVPL